MTRLKKGQAVLSSCIWFTNYDTSRLYKLLFKLCVGFYLYSANGFVAFHTLRDAKIYLI